MQLLWQPVKAATGDEAARALAGLFATHGAPLVLKSDNGSHFTCDVVQDLLARHDVACLFSPPHWPQFNGGIEAGIHALKDRTAARAARSGHPGEWSWDDVAAARWEANAFAAAPGGTGACPADIWATRTARVTRSSRCCRRCFPSSWATRRSCTVTACVTPT